MSKSLWIIVLIAAFNISAIAQESEEIIQDSTDGDRSPAAAAATRTFTPDKAQKRLYPGGKDEQDIKIQANLPTPSKSMDGVVPNEVVVPDDHD